MSESREVAKLSIDGNWWLWRGFIQYVRAREEFLLSLELEYAGGIEETRWTKRTSHRSEPFR